MIDRTSFDETDDFGVSQAAMTSAETYVAGPPVIMKDGKVRRRLRWRPKGMAKRRRAPSVLHKGSPSSNSSVISNSNFSQASKQSKKSLHSFASTETASINNTTKKSKKFPLPRPNYPKHLDGVATIGNEGDFIHARIQGTSAISPPTTLFAAADVLEDIRPQPVAAQGKTNTSKTRGVMADAKLASKNKAEARTLKGDPATSPHRLGLPPRFQRPTGKSKEEALVTTPSTSAGSMSPSEFFQSEDEDVSDGESSLVPVPVLSGDEVEMERRVDLRIRRTPSTLNTQNGMAKLEDGVDPLSVFELQFDEERQDQNPEIAITSVASNPSPSHTPPSLQSVMSDSFLANFRRNRKAVTKTMQNGLSTSSSISSKASEIRFSMTDTSAFARLAVSALSSSRTKQSSSSSDGNTTQKAHACPADVDNGTFLEAEKNLQAIHEMASEHLKQGEFVEALEVFEEILRGQLARYGEDHYRVGTALHNIGIVHMRRGDYVRALEVYKEAVRVRKMALDPFHADVAASLAQLGVAYMERNKHRKAIGAFREALKIRRRCLGNDHPKVAKILNNIGCSLFELDELEVAKVAFEEALDIQRNLLRHPPSDSGPISESSLLSIASTQSNIASIKLYCGQFDEAILDLEEALLIQQCALGDDHPLARRTHESLMWMERARNNAPDPVSADLLTSLTGTLSTKASQDSSGSMFDSLYSRFDLACRGWDGYDEDEAEGNVVEISSRE